MTASGEEKKARMEREREVLTKLFTSAFDGDWEKLKSVVDGYARQNDVSPFKVLSEFKDGEKRSALHFACQSSSNHEVDILESLFSAAWFPKQADIHALLKQKDNSGLTPIMLAAQHKDILVAQKRVLLLLSKAGDELKLGLARSQAGATALHYAAGNGATRETIEALHKAGKAAIQSFSNRGGTPLHWGCSLDKDVSTSTISTLLECGADVNAQIINEMGLVPPPLVLALAAGNESHANMLLEAEDLRLETNLPGNLTVFHMAADLNLASPLSKMLKKTGQGSSLATQMNHDGMTPLDVAAKGKHVECVQLLLQFKSGSEEPPSKQDGITFIDELQKTTSDKKPTIPVMEEREKETDKPKKEDEGPEVESDARKKASEIVGGPDVGEGKTKDALSLKAEGNAHFGKKEWQLACDAYSRAIEVNPKDGTFYSNRSACNAQLDKVQEALDDAIVTVALRPEWTKGYYRLAMARLHMERYEDAAMAAWDGLEKDDTNDELRSLLQKCVKKGRKDFLEKQKLKEASS